MYKIIENLAIKHGFTVYGLAKKAGVSYTNIMNFKYGFAKEVSFSMIEKLADAMGISMDEFRRGGDVK